MADTESILQLGIEAARAGDKAEARELFRLVTREKPDNAQGWLWLAGVAEDREEKRTALENVIRLDPNNELARKGLAAMGGAAAGAAAAAATSVTETPATTPVTTATVSTDVPDTTPPAATSNAATYDTPATSNDDTWTPTFADDDFDLQDRPQTPRADDGTEPASGVAVYDDEEEEEERRGGIGWLPWALGLVALALVLFLAFSFIRGRNNDAANGTGGVAAGVTTTADGTTVAGGVVDGSATTTTTTGEGGGLPIEGATAVIGDAFSTAVPGDAGVTTVPAEQTNVVISGEQTVPPVDQPPAEQTAAPIDDAPAEEPTVIVVVPPDASVVPPIAEVPTPEPPTPEAPAPTTAPVPETPSSDLATANPTIVPPGTQIQAGTWSFVYNGAQTAIGGALGSAPASQGVYQIVVVNVVNGSGQAASIPEGFFALKDGQGRVYELNVAASVGYMDRFGRGAAADISPDQQPAPGVLTSVGMAFDVAPDATNLVLLSRANTNQGFQVR